MPVKIWNLIKAKEKFEIGFLRLVFFSPRIWLVLFSKKIATKIDFIAVEIISQLSWYWIVDFFWSAWFDHSKEKFCWIFCTFNFKLTNCPFYYFHSLSVWLFFFQTEWFGSSRKKIDASNFSHHYKKNWYLFPSLISLCVSFSVSVCFFVYLFFCFYLSVSNVCCWSVHYNVPLI